MLPSRLVSFTAQNFWASASLRSARESLANEALIFRRFAADFRVACGSLFARFSHPAQQRNTILPSSVTLAGAPHRTEAVFCFHGAPPLRDCRLAICCR